MEVNMRLFKTLFERSDKCVLTKEDVQTACEALILMQGDYFSQLNDEQQDLVVHDYTALSTSLNRNKKYGSFLYRR